MSRVAKGFWPCQYWRIFVIRKKDNISSVRLGDFSAHLATPSGKRTNRKKNTCGSPLNRDEGLFLPQEYRALTLLDKTELVFPYLLVFLLATIGILNKLVSSL